MADQLTNPTSGWKVTARLVGSTSYVETYTDEDCKHPEFARGFIAGYCCAKGVPPEQIELTWEER